MAQNLPFQHQHNSDIYTSESDEASVHTQHNAVVLDRRSVVEGRYEDGPVGLDQISPHFREAPAAAMGYGAHPHSARHRDQSDGGRATSGR